MIVGIVGCGNMGEAVARGLIASGIPADDLVASHPRAQRRKELDALGLTTTTSNVAAVMPSDVVILAVKPQVIPDVLPEIAGVAHGKLVVSIAAGTPLKTLASALPSARLVRAMPNQPAAIRAGMTGLFAGKGVSEADRALVTKIFEAIGAVVWLASEKQFHALTALSASGPGFLYAIADALVTGGVEAGLPRDLALRLAAHAIAGAGRTLVETAAPPRELRDKVTSKKGTTLAGLAKLGPALPRVAAAVRAAADRSREMAGEPKRATKKRKK